MMYDIMYSGGALHQQLHNDAVFSEELQPHARYRKILYRTREP